MGRQRVFTYNTKGLSPVVGVILMVTITVAISSTVYLAMSSSAESNLSRNSMVFMKQGSNYILITNIVYGPIITSQTTIKVVDITDGTSSPSGSFLSTGDELKSGDIISLSGAIKNHEYEVTLIYSNTLVGLTKYFEY